MENPICKEKEDVYRWFLKDLEGEPLTEEEKARKITADKILKILNEQNEKEKEGKAKLTMSDIFTKPEVQEKVLEIIESNEGLRGTVNLDLCTEYHENSIQRREEIKTSNWDKLKEFLSSEKCTAIQALEILDEMIKGKTGLEKIKAAKRVWEATREGSEAQKAVEEEERRIAIEAVKEAVENKTGLEKIKAAREVWWLTRQGSEADKAVEKEERRIAVEAVKEAVKGKKTGIEKIKAAKEVCKATRWRSKAREAVENIIKEYKKAQDNFLAL